MRYTQVIYRTQGKIAQVRGEVAKEKAGSRHHTSSLYNIRGFIILVVTLSQYK